ncbi:MAG TPA: tryptophan synthase subunit alpha [Solirubrobacteraceae bacterium]|jgi:tryptophan synthase alpha chain|nr:tryptophan synthase subunit alpha [Solirubrobacteraceae bacterium]
MSVAVTGGERIAEAFESARADGRRAALMPYLMAGYPDLETSRRIAHAYVDGGADLIELGIPFSDPLADGPVIHAADVAAIAAGARVDDALGVALEVAEQVPVVVMCYVNVILARGLERFADMLLAVGASGLIVPDLPLEEAPAALAALDERGLALVPLVAPTTPDERLARIGARARGFLYTVSVTGTTGERAGNDDGLPGIVARAKAHTDVPVAVGFGIGTPEQASAAAGAGADGVIIGSRLVRAAGEAEDPAAGVLALVRAFAAALG